MITPISLHLQVISLLLLLIGLAGFTLYYPLMRALVAVAAILQLVSWYLNHHTLSCRTEQWYQLLRNNYVLWATILLILLVAIGTSYGVAASTTARVSGFFKYAQLIYLPLFIPLFRQAQSRRLAINCFIGSSLCDAGLSLLILKKWLIIDSYFGSGYLQYAQYSITASLLLSLSLFFLINRLIDEADWRWWYAVLYVVGSYILFFCYIERTGQLTFFALMGLTLWQRYRWRSLIPNLILLPSLFSVLFFSSPIFYSRINAAYQNLSQYYHSQGAQYQSNLGLRLAFLKYGIDLIKQHPIIGHGTGSFVAAYQTTKGPSADDKFLRDPHNEYLLWGIQLGSIGLCCLLIWLLLQWRESKALPVLERRYMQGTLLSFTIASFCNSVLYVGISGLTYILLFTIFLAARYDQPISKIIFNQIGKPNVV